MTRAFSRIDRLAGAAAARIAAWTLEHVAPDRRDWALALQAELEVLETGWQRLGWAAGGLRLAFHRRARAGAPQRPTAARAIPMDSDSGHDFGGWLTLFGRSLLAVLIAYLAVITSVALVPSRGSDWRSVPLAMLVAFSVALIPSIALRASLVTCLIGGQVAFAASELAFHLIAGIDKVQGGQAHWTVMVAGTLAVACGAVLERGRRAVSAGAVWDAKDLIGSVVRAGTMLRERTGSLAHGAAALFAFGLSEAAVHLVFGPHPFRDTVTHAAILTAAILGSMIGALSELVRARLSVPQRAPAGA